MEQQTCKDCGQTYPLTREFFGNFKNPGRPVGFRRTCRQCMRERTARHTAENPEQHRARAERRSAREREAGPLAVTFDVGGLRRRLGDACRYCADPLHGAGEVDHLTPVVRGGSGQPGNLTLACTPCNRAKLGKTLVEFQEWRRERGLANREGDFEWEAPDAPTTARQRASY